MLALHLLFEGSYLALVELVSKSLVYKVLVVSFLLYRLKSKESPPHFATQRLHVSRGLTTCMSGLPLLIQQKLVSPWGRLPAPKNPTEVASPSVLCLPLCPLWAIPDRLARAVPRLSLDSACSFSIGPVLMDHAVYAMHAFAKIAGLKVLSCWLTGLQLLADTWSQNVPSMHPNVLSAQPPPFPIKVHTFGIS